MKPEGVLVIAVVSVVFVVAALVIIASKSSRDKPTQLDRIETKLDKILEGVSPRSPSRVEGSPASEGVGDAPSIYTDPAFKLLPSPTPERREGK